MSTLALKNKLHSRHFFQKWCVMLAGWFLFSWTVHANPPSTFEQAKHLARTQVYYDRAPFGDLYCGCSWTWTGQSGGRMHLDACGYAIRSQPHRAARLEWEHIVPASHFGRQRQCWQVGGREHCKATDPVFNRFEADLHNLSPAVGEVNADRSNHRFGMLPSTPFQHGSCPFKVDFSQRVAEPRDAVKGMVARTSLYVADHYGVSLSDQQRKLFLAWHRQYPVTDWEKERNRRIARIMGHGNPFVTNDFPANEESPVDVLPPRSVSDTTDSSAPFLPFVGNQRSLIYHAPGCPHYGQVSAAHRVLFVTRAEAELAGYRRAKNCP